MPRIVAAILVLIAVVFTAEDARAHEGEEIEEIIVRGRWDKPHGLMVSASQGLVSQADIELRPRLRVGDLLEVVPGLIVTQHSGTGKSNQMFLRGFNLDHGTDFATWIDGMPINLPTHGHGQGYTDLNFIIPELIDSIEFRKGPYYTDVSDFSSAGAAFFSTPRRLDAGIVKAGLGEDGLRQVLLADSFDLDGSDLLLAVQSQRYDGPWIGVSEDLEKFNGLLRYGTSEPDVGEWNITLMGYDASWNSADQIPVRAVDAGLVSRFGTVDDTVGGETSRYSVSGRWHRDFGDQQLTARAYAIDYDLSLFSNFTYFLEDPVNGDQFEQIDERRIWGGDVSWQWNVEERMIHRLGATLRYDDIDRVGLFKTAERRRLDVVRLDGVKQLSSGLYYDVENVWNDRWRSTLGVRADYYHFDVDANNPLNGGRASDSVVSPKLNVIRTLTKNAEAYLGAGVGFHSNDARGTVIDVDPTTGEAAAPVDALVQSTGAELGLRYFLDEKLNLSVALWLIELDSELLFIGDAGSTEASRPSRRYGVELPVYYRIDDTWLLDFELALTRSRFTDSNPAGDDIPGSIERVIAAGITAAVENGVYGSLRGRYFGERPLTEDTTVMSGDSMVWNLGTGYRNDRFDVRIEVLNLFDSDDDDITYFYTSRLRGEPSAGLADIHFHPIEPRTVRLHITWYNRH